MSFIGNIAAAQTAKVIGRYNQSVMNQQAAYARRKAEIKEQVYNSIEKPRLLDQQDQPLPCSILAIYPTLVTSDG